MSKVEDLILEAYATDPKVVDEDWYLMGAVWKLDGWDENKGLFQNLKSSISAESITRARRKLHEDGRIKYSKDAEDRRYEEYKKKTDEYSNSTRGEARIEIDEENNTVRMF